MFYFLGDVQPLSPYREKSPSITIENNFSKSTSNTFSSNPHLKVPCCDRRSPRQIVSRDLSSEISFSVTEKRKKKENISPVSSQCSSSFLLSNSSFQESIRQAKNKNGLLGNYREPPSSFKCMDERRKFNYLLSIIILYML